jgi:hypothetical protein
MFSIFKQQPQPAVKEFYCIVEINRRGNSGQIRGVFSTEDRARRAMDKLGATEPKKVFSTEIYPLNEIILFS